MYWETITDMKLLPDFAAAKNKELQVFECRLRFQKLKNDVPLAPCSMLNVDCNCHKHHNPLNLCKKEFIPCIRNPRKAPM